ncbi:MAG: hypothetical protein ACRCW2_13620 [Cellulosilyticaceae bacterium]
MKKKVIIAVAILASSLIAANGTVAWLVRSQVITNQFVPTKVTGEIEENMDGKVKKNVAIKNTSDIPAYIRVALVPTWMDEQDNATPLKTEGTYTTVDIARDPTWIVGTDGFYYYKESVNPGSSTKVLIGSVGCKPIEGLDPEYEGKYLQIDVIASLIQALPEEAAEEAWGVSVTNGILNK